MEVSVESIKELREQTGAGIMDCKRALQETKGNMDEAEQYLISKGIASAAKKASRVTNEGLILSLLHI